MVITAIKASFRVLLNPKSFFEQLSEGYTLGSAVIFLSLMTGVFSLILFIEILVSVLVRAHGGEVIHFLTVLSGPLFLSILVVYLLTILLSFVMAAMMHIFVLLFRGKGGFGGTFNVLAFAGSAYMILGEAFKAAALWVTFSGTFVPLILINGAALVAVLWGTRIFVAGYKAIHKMGSLRSLAAYIAPIVVFIGIFIAAGIGRYNIDPKAIGFIGSAAGQVFNALETREKAAPSSGPGGANVPYAINWHYGLRDQLRAADRDGKPLMADFYTEWCEWCRKLDQVSYKDRSVRALSEGFICVKVNAENDKDSTSKYGVIGYPTIIFFAPDGTVIKRSVGYVDAAGLAGAMKDVSDKYPAKKTDAQFGMRIPAIFKEALPKYRLTAIGLNRGKPNAIINNGIVNVGDRVGEAKVVDIKKDRVVILENGKEIVLEPK